MTLAEARAQKDSERFWMMRLTVGYRAPESEWLDGVTSTIWRLPIEHLVFSVEKNGAAMTEVTTASVANNEFYYDLEAGLLYVGDSTGNPNDAASNTVVVKYYLHMTAGRHRYSSDDPATTSSGSRQYDPRILSAGPFSQSFENALSGVLTVSSSMVTLDNSDAWLQEHLDEDHSIQDQEVRFWQGIRHAGQTYYAAVYHGRVDSLSISEKTVTLSIFDELKKLEGLCLMGDSVEQATLASSYSGSYPRADDVGLPIKFVAGRHSFVSYRRTSANPYYGGFAVVDAERAFPVDYSDTLSQSVNRTWICCRLPSGSSRTQTIGSILAEDSLSFSGHTAWYLNLSSHNLIVGEWVKFTKLAVDYYGVVIEVVNGGTSLGPGLTQYNVVLMSWTNGNIPTPSTCTITPLALPVVAIRWTSSAGVTIVEPVYPTHFSVAYTALDGGNYRMSVTLTTDISIMGHVSSGSTWEDTYGPLNPETMDVLFIALPSGDQYHGDNATRIMEAAGLTVDSASVAAANAALAIKTVMTIPTYGESSFRSYREYLQDITRSIGAYVRIDTDGVASYELLGAATPTETITETDMIDGSQTIEMDGNDLTYQMACRNDHQPTEEGTLGVDYGFTGSFLRRSTWPVSDTSVRYLHSRSLAVEFVHVLEFISDYFVAAMQRAEYLLSLRAAPRVLYGFKAATVFPDVRPGDDRTLEAAHVIGGSAAVKIVSVEYAEDGTTIKGATLP